MLEIVKIKALSEMASKYLKLKKAASEKMANGKVDEYVSTLMKMEKLRYHFRNHLN